MGTVVKFTPLMGVGEDAPLCSLLEIDDYCILLDCGWSEEFDEAQLEPVKSVLPRVKALLLSHPDPPHLGALPHLVGRCGLRCPVFSTKPTRRMGEMFMFEQAVGRQAISDFTAYSLDDVDAAFRLHPSWTELRYSQRHELLPPLAANTHQQQQQGRGAGHGGDDADGGPQPSPGGGIWVTPHPAGRFPGGAVWRISLGCGEEVVYACDYNHRKERLLNETTFHELLSSCQPALLVSDALNGLAPALDRRRRDEDMLAAISATVECGGSVLMPTDPAGRVLELALMLDEHFASTRTGATPVLLTSTIRTVLEFARSQLEYFGSEMAHAFALKRTVPFVFRKLVVATSVEELHAVPGPKVVLATQLSLESGPARQLLVEWAAQPRNTVIFTERAAAGTLAATLQHHVPGPEPLCLPLRVARRVPLEGEELEAWQRQQAAEQEAAVAAAEEALATEGAFLDISSTFALPSTPSLSRGSLSGRPSLSQPLTPAGSLLLPGRQSVRASCGSISRLVRDSATGAIVQQLGAGSSGAGGGPGASRLGASVVQGVAAAVEPEAPNWDDSLLMDGFVPPKDALHPMFPDEDEALEAEWDEYGAVLAKDEFRVPSIAEPGAGSRPGPDGMEVDGGPGAGGGGSAGDGGGGGPGDNVADEVAEPPTKLVEEEVQLEVRAALRFYDFEGRSDGRAMRDYLARVAPRRLALVRGGEAARAELAGALRHDLADHGTAVYTPGPGEAVVAHLAPSQLAALDPRLALTVRTAGQYGVSWLEGVFRAATSTGHPPPQGPDGVPLLTIHPLDGHDGAAEAAAAGGGGTGGSGSVLLAQAGAALTLSKLKAALAAAGFESHFPSRGVLAVVAGPGAGGGELVVTLGGGLGHGAAGGGSERAQVVLEGPTCDAYYRVREVIYTQFGVC